MRPAYAPVDASQADVGRKKLQRKELKVWKTESYGPIIWASRTKGGALALCCSIMILNSILTIAIVNPAGYSLKSTGQVFAYIG